MKAKFYFISHAHKYTHIHTLTPLKHTHTYTHKEEIRYLKVGLTDVVSKIEPIQLSLNFR